MLTAIKQALEKHDAWRRERCEVNNIKSKMNALTPRESEVLNLVVQGLLNKQIGAELGIAEKTVKVHRSRVMEKMRVGSLAELVQVADKIRFLE